MIRVIPRPKTFSPEGEKEITLMEDINFRGSLYEKTRKHLAHSFDIPYSIREQYQDEGFGVPRSQFRSKHRVLGWSKDRLIVKGDVIGKVKEEDIEYGSIIVQL